MTEKEESPKLSSPKLLGSSRLAIVIMCSLASFVALFSTINLGMAIVCMSPPQSNETNEYSNCTSRNPSRVVDANCNVLGANNHTNDYNWNKKTQGMLLSAPYYGVVSMQLIIGWLCDKFGKNKLIMMIGVGLLTMASLVSPAVIQFDLNFFFGLRIIKGIAMATCLSSIMPMLTYWTTSEEQGLFGSLAFAGVSLANALTYPISAFLCQYGGWQWIFYFAGICGIVWLVCAFFILHDKPSAHPRISVEEKQYLLTLIKHSGAKKSKVVIPWLKILTSIPVWSVIMTSFLFFAGNKGLIINLPIYVKDMLNFTVTENGVFSSFPATFALIVRLAAGPVFDRARASGRFSLTVWRKIFHAVGSLIPAATMFIVSQLDPELKYVIISLISIGFAMIEVTNVGGYTFCLLDIAPRFIGVIQGINNTIGLAPGFIMPLVIAALTPNGSREEWSHVFLMFGGLFSLGAAIFILTGSSKLQKWADPQDPQTPETAPKHAL